MFRKGEKVIVKTQEHINNDGVLDVRRVTKNGTITKIDTVEMAGTETKIYRVRYSNAPDDYEWATEPLMTRKGEFSHQKSKLKI